MKNPVVVEEIPPKAEEPNQQTDRQPDDPGDDWWQKIEKRLDQIDVNQQELAKVLNEFNRRLVALERLRDQMLPGIHALTAPR